MGREAPVGSRWFNYDKMLEMRMRMAELSYPAGNNRIMPIPEYLQSKPAKKKKKQKPEKIKIEIEDISDGKL